MDKIYTSHPEYGARKIQLDLHDLPLYAEKTFNLKRIRRLMKVMGIEAIYCKPNLSQADKAHEIYPYLLKNVPITHNNQVWSTDITYIPMQRGFLYLVAIIDWYSRFILSWQLSNTLTVDFCLDCLKYALKIYGKPHIFNTDQGSQFTSLSFIGELKSNEILISMDSNGRALDNIIIERFWRTLKYDYIYLNAFEDGWELQKGIAEFMQFYNYQRKHQSLAYLTPAQVYLQKMVPTFKNTKIAQLAITLIS